jgi:hypothetical protein
VTGVQIPREIGVSGRIAHPDPLRAPDGEYLELIVDHAVFPLWDGETILGWKGDPRLALYFNKGWLRWELWRLELDNVYRMTTWWSADEVRGSEVIGRCILFCLTSDREKGYDPHVHVHEANDAAMVPVRDKIADMKADALDRVRYGIKKDTK